MSETPTASTFKDAMLVVLLDHADRDGVVGSGDATDHVLRMHGWDRTSFGDNERGQSVVALIVNQTMNKILKPNGLAEGAGHGKWKLTPSGIEAAQAVRQAMNEQADTVIDPKVWGEGGGRSWEPPRTGPSYHDDPYIVGLARDKSTCHGKYSARSEVCASCPLVVSCVEASLEVLAQIANHLDKRDERLARGDRPEPEPLISGGDETLDLINNYTEPTAPPARDWSNYSQQVEFNSAEARCEKCRNTIMVNETMMWVNPNPYGVLPGVYHIGCWDEVS